MLHDNNRIYGKVSRFFHWLMAILIIWQLFKLGDRIADGEHWIGQTLVPWHVSIGTVLLVLVLLRIMWAFTQRKQRPLQNPATAFLVKAGHFLLYACMVLMPVTGILYMVGKGYGLKAFDVQIIARGAEIEWAAAIGGLHSPIAWLLVLLVLGHIGIALIHHFIKRDDTLRRMW
jgi:cytochrome b561